MNAFASLGTAVLLLSLGTIVPAFAQQEAKPEQKQQRRSTLSHNMHSHSNSMPRHSHSMSSSGPNRNSSRKQRMPNNRAKTNNSRLSSRNQNKQQQQQARQQNVQQPAHHTQEQQRVQQAAWQGHQSQNWQSDHRTWQQRGGYHGYRIPDNRYNGYFGSNHAFVIYSQPYMVVGGFPRFQYGGYWFSLVDPWPGYWANNWYETDDVYVAYVDNGYYMYNQRYPGVGIAISVSM